MRCAAGVIEAMEKKDASRSNILYDESSSGIVAERVRYAYRGGWMDVVIAAADLVVYYDCERSNFTNRDY